MKLVCLYVAWLCYVLLCVVGCAITYFEIWVCGCFSLRVFCFRRCGACAVGLPILVICGHDCYCFGFAWNGVLNLGFMIELLRIVLV